MSQLYGVFVILLIIVIEVIESKKPELRFVNVIFRHGDRAPECHGNELYPNDPYLHEDFFPIGVGGLTNHGKSRMYNLGINLRKMYDNYLGKVYLPEDIMPRSTEFKRTRMSLSLVLAGLYPPAPVQMWNPQLNWQPIPITYVPNAYDTLLTSEECPRYLKELRRVKLLPEVIAKVEKYRLLMNNLTIHTGKLVNNTNVMYNLYHGLIAEQSMGLKLPDWTNEIFPNGSLYDATLLEYEIESYNDLLKRLNGGPILKRITDDMVATVKGTTKEARKLNLISCHENNIAAFLETLGVFKPHVPQYSSAVIVELLEIDGGYFVKVLYYLGIPATVEELHLPGCSGLCSLDSFLILLENVRPTDEELYCPKNITEEQSSCHR